MKNRYPFEPFVYKTVKPIPLLGKEDRLRALQDAFYNLFRIPADKVTIDLLTDSGTGALSEEQWSALMRGDESYAWATSWSRQDPETGEKKGLEPAVREFSGITHVIPVHQGRAAEKVMAEALLGPDDVVLANTLFDTTRANFEYRKALCVDIPAVDLMDARPDDFKGNIDFQKLDYLVRNTYRGRVKIIVMTLTNNSGGGQPASLRNIEAVSNFAHKHNILFLIDACRIAENSYFVWKNELRKEGTVAEVVQKTFALCDLAHMSAKKDGLANIGGFIVTNRDDLKEMFEELVILYEGYLTYGGMSGREMETIAQGLKEVVKEDYLAHRVGQVAYLHRGLSKAGFPLVNPPGGHAVYIDAGSLLPHIPKEEFPGHALAVALYAEGGIRSVEIGSLMFDKHVSYELVRLALPRRVYTQSHLDYVIDVCKKIFKEKDIVRGFTITWEPKALRHFSCKLQPIS